MLFGLAPALQSQPIGLESCTSNRKGASAGSRERERELGAAWSLLNFALSLVLMVAAGLLLRSFWDLLNVQLDLASIEM